jgi:hypothetical protein
LPWGWFAPRRCTCSRLTSTSWTSWTRRSLSWSLFELNRVCPAVLVCLVPRQIRAFVMLQLLLRLDFREALADRKKSVDSDFDSDFALSISEHSPQSQSLLLPPSKSYVTTPSHIWHTRRLGSVTVLARCLGTQTSQCHSLGALSKGRSITAFPSLILSFLSSSVLGRLRTRTRTMRMVM